MKIETAMKCAESDLRLGLAVAPDTVLVIIDELRRLQKLLECKLVGGFW